VFVVLGLACAIVPASAAGMAGDPGPHPLRLSVGTLGTIGSLDPRTGDSQIAREVWKLQYPTLTALDPKTLAPTPGLALAWTPVAGRNGWTYRLRPGLTWSDGKPVTATDVVYSLEHARDGAWPYAKGMLDDLEGKAIDARTVKITSTHPKSPGLLLHVVPARVFQSAADISGDLAKLGVADGMWHVVAKSDASVQLDGIGSATPAVKQIVFSTYPNAGALIHALAGKKIDVASGIPASDVDRVATLPNVTIDRAGTPETTQAFRSDNVNGFLKDPEQASPVVFAPTISQYSDLYAAGRPAGEKASNTAYIVGAVIVLTLCGIAYWIASRVRRHYVPLEETPAHG
jgi:peptide/nickel transport system substrate-binding protein